MTFIKIFLMASVFGLGVFFVTMIAYVEFALKIPPDYVLIPNIIIGFAVGTWSFIKSVKIYER